MKALFRCEKNWQKINVQRFSANFLFSKNGKCRSITYSGDFATLPDCPLNREEEFNTVFCVASLTIAVMLL